MTTTVDAVPAAASAPSTPSTWWEDGRTPGLLVVAAAAVAQAAVVVVDLALTGRVSQFGDLCFVVVCLAMAVAVRLSDAFVVALAPPVLMLLTVGVLAIAYPAAVAGAADGPAQAVLSGLTHHSAGLAGGFVVCLGALAVRLLARASTPAP